MKLTRKSRVVTTLLIVMVMMFGTFSIANGLAMKKASKSADKITLVGIAKSADWKWADALVKKMQDHFPEYNFVIKSFDSSNIDKTLKTMIAAGNPPDFSFYWPNYINNYVTGNMALDLTPYLTANNNEWANTFQKGTLDIGKINGKIYDIPFESVYPMIIVNKDITDKAGVTIPDGPWTWEQFMSVCQKIQTKLGKSNIFPFGMRWDWACWIVRNGLMTNWSSIQKSNDFAAGKISLLDPNVVKVFDNAKAFYDKNYAYPGKGAIASKVDEIMAAFKAGKIAMVADVNSQAGPDIKNSGLKNIQIVSWPHMGPQNILIGGCDGWFIPANAAHKDDAIKVLKYMTSKEAMQLIANVGSPVTIKGVTSSDKNFSQYAKDTSKITRSEIVTLSPMILDELTNKMPADYLNKGISSLKSMESMRQQALSTKE